MTTYVVVDKTTCELQESEDVPLITAEDYFFKEQFLDPQVSIINQCPIRTYQSIGYYVSLIALARNHNVSPSISEIMMDCI